MTADLLSLNPFHRLAELLKPLRPGPSPLPDGRLANLSVGDPRTPLPALALEAMRAAEAGWSRYAGARNPDYLAACADWLSARFALPAGRLDPARHLVTVGGSREGLFHLCLAAVAEKRAVLAAAGRGQEAPLVLLPDPGYHVYAGAAAAAGAEAHFVPVTAAGGHLPRYDLLPAAVLERAAIAFLCSPANPQGVVASPELLGEALLAARRHGFVLAVDECYCELYEETPPVGALSVAERLGDGLERLVVAHSLSKRSGGPGLRLGFLAGDPALIRAVEGFLRFGGSGPGLPLLAAGSALWRDESHVAANRAYYRGNMALAERILGNAFGWRPPAGGFFLWLDVSPGRFADGEAAASALYVEGGMQVLPGAYMSLGQSAPGAAPGARYIRVSLAEPPALLEPLLTRMAEILL